MPSTEVSQFGELSPVTELKDVVDLPGSSEEGLGASKVELRVVVRSGAGQYFVHYAPKSIDEALRTRELNKTLRYGYVLPTAPTSK